MTNLYLCADRLSWLGLMKYEAIDHLHRLTVDTLARGETSGDTADSAVYDRQRFASALTAAVYITQYAAIMYQAQ